MNVVRKSAKNRVFHVCVYSQNPYCAFPGTTKNNCPQPFCGPEFIYLPSNSKVFCYLAEDVLRRDEKTELLMAIQSGKTNSFDASHPGKDLALDFSC